MTPGDILLPYQRQWIEEESNYAIYLKSRRIGVSWAEAAWSVRRRIIKKIDHFFVSANLQTAIEFIRYCKQWAEVANVACSDRVIDVDGGNLQTLTFPNGSRILALSSNPSALRGMGGDVTLDEFAFHENQEELYTAAQPVRQWGGLFRVISTQHGPQTAFYRLVEEARTGANGFKLYQTNLFDAVGQGLALRVPGDHQTLLPDREACDRQFIEQLRQTAWSPEAFAQEYLCEVCNVDTIITPEEYDKCVFPALQPINELDPEGKYGPLYIGVDIGRSKNLTVLWVLEKGMDAQAPRQLRECYRTVLVKSLANMPFQAQFQALDKIIGHRSVYRVCVDAGGIGMQLAEDLTSKYGSKVEEVSIGHLAKARIVERTKKFVAQIRVSLPDDPTTKSDLIAMRRVASKAGNYSYDGSSGVSHCDRFIALGLALEAADTSVHLAAATNSENNEQPTRSENGSVPETSAA